MHFYADDDGLTHRGWSRSIVLEVLYQVEQVEGEGNASLKNTYMKCSVRQQK